MIPKPTLKILAVGELLVDMISADFAETLDDVKNFVRIAGGSPANMCANMARLGNDASLVATIGNDDMGQFLKNTVAATGTHTDYIRTVELPSTLILVTRSRQVSNFEAYRSADKMILASQFPKNFKEFAIFHTTCFALSMYPAQATILKMAKKAASQGSQLSIDANYAQKIWNNRVEAQQVVADYCALGALVKISEVDWERLYETPLTDAEAAAQHFLKLGARAVCVTLGEKGCLAASASETHFLPSRPVEVKDTTGAGDAFWSGFLTAFLDKKSLLNCAKAGRRMAEIKLSHFGSLPEKVERALIYSDF
jgi:sugar/nucleoside kinase (ribokinase family)